MSALAYPLPGAGLQSPARGQQGSLLFDEAGELGPGPQQCFVRHSDHGGAVRFAVTHEEAGLQECGHELHYTRISFQ